jgi:hypothetical protein
MGVSGGSYGGFMTAWITTKTTRFKAAEADRMISDWNAWWGTTDVQSLTNDEFFGKPWENQVMYDTLSPIRFVKRVKTPTLIVQSEEDHRTPMATADMWYMALKTLNVPAEFVRYRARITTCRGPANRGCWSTGSGGFGSGSAIGWPRAGHRCRRRPRRPLPDVRRGATHDAWRPVFPATLPRAQPPASGSPGILTPAARGVAGPTFLSVTDLVRSPPERVIAVVDCFSL